MFFQRSTDRRPSPITHHDVDVRRLRPEQIEALIEELYAVQSAVFDGVDCEAFRRYVTDPSATAAWLHVMRDREQRAIGYYAAQLYECTINGRLCAVFRGEAGVLPAYRGAGNLAAFALRCALPYMVRHPLRPTYVLSCPVHPVLYRMVAKYIVGAWPLPGSTPSAERQALILELADRFGLSPVPGSSPLVRRVGWVTRQSEADELRWAASNDPITQHYFAHNPGYKEGNGLLIAFPISAPLGLLAAGRVGVGRLQRRLRGRQRASS